MEDIIYIDSNGVNKKIPLSEDILKNTILHKDLLFKMKLARRFEERVNELYAAGFIHGTTHLAIGQEAAAIASTAVFKLEDKILVTHRGHLESIGKGMPVADMYAELLGKATGASKGYGGSMHMINPQVGVMHANGIVAANAPLVCGLGLAQKKQKIKAISACYIGDGGMNEGAYSESLNLASLWKLPVIFITINNQYGMSTPIENSHANVDLGKRGIAFNLPTIIVDGNNVFAVYQATKLARQLALDYQPVILILNTYRISGHSRSDKNRYRKPGEIEAWQDKCPISFLENYLLDQDRITLNDLKEMEIKVDKQIQVAIDFAMESPPAKEILWKDN